MSVFNYNSYHKIITALILVGWSIFQFSSKEEQQNYSNGQTKKSGRFVSGKSHGAWIWYYENGQQKMKGYFDKGKRTGLWFTFAKNGDTLTHAQYSNDQLNGEFIRWEDQHIIERKSYKNDVLVE